MGQDRDLSASAVDALREVALPLGGSAKDFDPLLAAIGDARLVLIGEASHGTHDFYRVRAEITKLLLAERSFGAVAIEGDWPDAWRVNRYVRGVGGDPDASEALAGFRRFPTWMWRNADVLDFVGWLRAYNEGKGEAAAGFYGLDLYSLHASMEAVLEYLGKVDPAAARRARGRYACFDHFGEDVQAYGYTTSFGLTEPCDDYFQAEQNARLVRNAEHGSGRGAEPGPAGAGTACGGGVPHRLQHPPGTVTAATDWGAPAERKRVRPSLPGSYERLFHDTGQSRFLLLSPDDVPAVQDPRLQRAIGVIYRPETERQSHYLEARLGRQFDAVLHYDVTRAVDPLEPGSLWDPREPPETYPTGV